MLLIGAPLAAWGVELKIASVAATSSGLNSFIRTMTRDSKKNDKGRKLFSGKSKLIEADAIITRKTLPRPLAISLGFAPEFQAGKSAFIRSEVDFRASTLRSSDSDGRLELIVRKKSDSAGALFLRYDLDFK